MLPYTTILAVLLGITNAKPLAMPQGLDFGVVDDLPPPPSVSIAVGVASQVVTVNEASAVASVEHWLPTVHSPTPWMESLFHLRGLVSSAVPPF